MLHELGSLPRRLRWALHKWSPSADRAFHNALFEGQRYDPFSFAYPGYVTIRRFAELAESHLTAVRHAVDLGCGPGEITCELARRNPSIRFTGVDHSDSAIARANEHKAALGLPNVTFQVGDIAAVTIDDVDAVMMFDSFHHLLDPARFVRELEPRVRRFVLIEPAGDWLGGWQRTLDLDWIVSAIDGIRARLAWQMGEPIAVGTTSAAPLQHTGEPVEHRYTVSDLEHFFEGYGLEIRGTIAGLDVYPPNPHVRHPLGEDFGRIAADTVVAVDNVLVTHNLDLHAKHWVVCAERGAPHRRRTPRPLDPQQTDSAQSGAGPYDVEFLACDTPASVRAGATLPVALTFRNASWRSWRSDTPGTPIMVSYHWLDAEGAVVAEDGRRSPLPRSVEPGDTCRMTCTVDVPSAPGRYVLAFDLVEEGVSWFSRAGAPMKKQAVHVR